MKRVFITATFKGSDNKKEIERIIKIIEKRVKKLIDGL